MFRSNFRFALIAALALVGCGGGEEAGSPPADPTADARPGGTGSSIPPPPSGTESRFVRSAKPTAPMMAPDLAAAAMDPFGLLSAPPAPPEGIEVTPVQILKLDAVSVGRTGGSVASAALVRSELETPPGPLGHASIGDYVLKNGRMSLFFRRVERRRAETPLFVPLRPPSGASAGALLDVMLPETPVDFLASYTQGLGPKADDPAVIYDSAEFVQRAEPAAVGIRFTGFAADAGAAVRLETTWWLAPDADRAEIVTEFAPEEPEGERERPLLVDAGVWGPGVMANNALRIAPGEPGRGEVEWIAFHAGAMSLGVYPETGTMEGTLAAGITRLAFAGGEDVEAGAKSDAVRRWFVVAPGNISSVTDRIFAARSGSRPVGGLQGTVTTDRSRAPAPDAWVDVFGYDREIGPDSRWLVSRADVDEAGRYSLTLPITDLEKRIGYYFIGTGAGSRGGVLAPLGLGVTPDLTQTRDLFVSEPARLTVRVRDSVTSAPLEARVRFEPLPPSPLSHFRSVTSVDGYLDSFYTDRAGVTVPMNQGYYTLTVTRGLAYDEKRIDIETAWDRETIVDVALERTSPAKGWQGLLAGAMTTATRGCTYTPRDVILTALAEGADWVVSGDLNVITDLEPAVRALGAVGRIGTSRGFRTGLPAHPEWGEFMIWPVAADAPDPSTASAEWEKLGGAKEFVATLRRIYPGALIQPCHLYSDSSGTRREGTGYFFHPEWNVYQMAWHDYQRMVELDFGVDAVNLYPAGRHWSPKWENDFFFINTLNGRFYAPVPLWEARIPFRSEPGYPRVLVNTGLATADVTEKLLIASLREGRWQITSGPFIDVTFDGRVPGALYDPGEKAWSEIRITAPSWAATTHIERCRDGIMFWKESDTADVNYAWLRHEYRGPVEVSPERKGGSDTLLNAAVWSERPISVIAPGAAERGVASFAVTGPVIADTNGNGRWDPPIYRDKGK